MGALDTAVHQGKALYVGISSYLTEQTKDVLEICKSNGLVTPIIHQPNYSMLNRWVEENLLDCCAENGIGVIVFCPLFQGLLTDKYLKGIPEVSRVRIQQSPLRKNEVSEQNIRVIQELNNLAEVRGQSLAQMALSWVLRSNRVTSCLLYTSPSPRDRTRSRMPSSA